jgi:hypothetical protein
VAALFALGHHLFYSSLDGKPAGAVLEEYSVLGVHMSDQQFNTAVGTAFAFLVRALLVVSISVAYLQILFWTITRRENDSIRLGHLDVIMSALQDLTSLVSPRSWFRRPLLWIMAVVAW